MIKVKNHTLDQLDKIIAYENGELNIEQTIDLFQELLDDGLVWRLQGHYGRMASELMNLGYINEK